MTAAEEISIGIGIISLIGVAPVVQVWFEWLGQLRPARRFIDFDSRKGVDVILTTSAVEPSRLGANVVRATTGIGQVQGVSYLSRFLGTVYANKKVSISISKATAIRPDRDLVLLGGPSKNEFSLRFIEKFTESNPGLKLRLDDSATRLEVGDNKFTIDHLRIENGAPKNDIALVIVWKNPFSSEASRAVYCSGMTSYGTAAATAWLFHDVLMSPKRRENISRMVGKRSPSFLAVLEVDILNGSFAAVREKLILPIPPEA